MPAHSARVISEYEEDWLKFTLDPARFQPWTEVIKSDVLMEFLRMDSSDNKQLSDFVRKFGPLGIAMKRKRGTWGAEETAFDIQELSGFASLRQIRDRHFQMTTVVSLRTAWRAGDEEAIRRWVGEYLSGYGSSPMNLREWPALRSEVAQLGVIGEATMKRIPFPRVIEWAKTLLASLIPDHVMVQMKPVWNGKAGELVQEFRFQFLTDALRWMLWDQSGDAVSVKLCRNWPHRKRCLKYYVPGRQHPHYCSTACTKHAGTTAGRSADAENRCQIAVGVLRKLRGQYVGENLILNSLPLINRQLAAAGLDRIKRNWLSRFIRAHRS
jgi:hypothetical protein